MSYILLTMWSKLLFDVYLFMLLMIEDRFHFVSFEQENKVELYVRWINW